MDGALDWMSRDVLDSSLFVTSCYPPGALVSLSGSLVAVPNRNAFISMEGKV